jgi:EAL domain-containing protein (putative c-di-GMP-specific phosphodiesterase class I)
MQALAEGIETPEQLDVIRDLGCSFGQGFLFARPSPAGELRELLVAGPIGIARPRPARVTSRSG